MSDLSAAALAIGAPEAIVFRSAAARAKASGGTAESVLTTWAGGLAAPMAASSSEEPGPAPVATPKVDPAPAATPAPTPPSPQRPLAPTAPIEPLPPPDTVNPEEALQFAVVVSVPSEGIKERTSPALPSWISSLLVVLPLFALVLFAGDSGAPTCGGVVLAVDRATGTAENCDGTPYQGRGGSGAEAGRFLTLGRETYVQCAGCHGPSGGGVGAIPALTEVVNIFSNCSDHLEWVELGSSGFLTSGRTTYGDTAIPVGGSGAQMPAFTALDPEALAAVVAYERITFGGADTVETLIACGLIEPEGEEASEVPSEAVQP